MLSFSLSAQTPLLLGRVKSLFVGLTLFCSDHPPRAIFVGRCESRDPVIWLDPLPPLACEVVSVFVIATGTP